MRLRLVLGAGVSLSDSGYGRLKKLPSGRAKFAAVGVGVMREPRYSTKAKSRKHFRDIKSKNKKKRFKTMANHKSSKKRIRQTVTKRAHNRLYHKTTRNAVKALRNTTERSAAEALLPKVSSMLDKLAKTNIIHKNKAANLKSSLALHVNAL